MKFTENEKLDVENQVIGQIAVKKTSSIEWR